MWKLTVPYKSSEHPPSAKAGECLSDKNPRNTTNTNKTSYPERPVPKTQRETESADGVLKFPWLESNGAGVSWVLRVPCGLLNLNDFPHSWLSASFAHQTGRWVKKTTDTTDVMLTPVYFRTDQLLRQLWFLTYSFCNGMQKKGIY